MDSEDIEEYVKYAKKILDENPQMDEANTKAKLLRDLLELLDWDFATDVELEYPVPMATRTHKVDYALLVEDTPVVFVEAKGCDSSLSDDHREQLRSYMRNQNIDWGLLTNGRTNEVYQRHVENSNVTVHRLGRAEIDELVQKSTLFSALSKQFIETGEAEKIAQRITEIEHAKDELQDNKEEIAEEVARTIAERVGDSISKQAENEAKTLVDNLIAELENETETPDDFWTAVEHETGIVKQHDEILLQEEKSGAEQLQDFIDFLLRHQYLGEHDIPVEMGRKRYLINTDPTDQEDDGMKRPKEVGEGFYVEVNQRTDKMKSNILNLGEQFS